MKSFDTTGDSPFNLNHIYKAPSSLFQFLAQKNNLISGICYPWVYVGMVFASFCWHVEDNYMYSINYMHLGGSKIWYTVPGPFKEQVDEALRKEHPQIYQKKPNSMHDLLTCLNPIDLSQKYGIPVHRVVQNPGEFIVTFPKGYHSGVSTGYNIAEAVNFASAGWIKYYFESFQDYLKPNYSKKSPYPIEWVINKCLSSIGSAEFSEEDRETIKKTWEKLKEKEQQSRLKTRKSFNLSGTISLEAKYDKFTCKGCEQYAYLSCYQCTECKSHYCWRCLGSHKKNEKHEEFIEMLRSLEKPDEN